MIPVLFFVPPPAQAALAAVPPDGQIGAHLERAARARRIPTVLLKALAFRMSDWKSEFADTERVGLLGVPTKGRDDSERLKTDWAYNIDEGAKLLEIAWNRAPILGNGRLDEGRNILECWYFALGRYGTGKEGKAAWAFADTVLNAAARGGDGRFSAVSITRPDPKKLDGSRNAFGPPAPWHFGDISPRPKSSAVVDLEMPYVQQAWDSPDGFDGGGSCGPSAVLMALAFLGKLAPSPVTITGSYPHTSEWGGHIKPIDDAICEENLGTVHAKLLKYVQPFFPTAALYYDEKATWARVKAELDAGRPVILGTRVTPAGHLMTARGYLSDNRVIVNDPAGDQTLAARRNAPDGGFSPTGNRYWNGGGRGARYDWEMLQVRWILTFGPSTPDADRPEDEP